MDRSISDDPTAAPPPDPAEAVGYDETSGSGDPGKQPGTSRPAGRKHSKWALLGTTAAGVVLALVIGWFGGLLVGKIFDPDSSTASTEASESAPASTEPSPVAGEPSPIAITGSTLFDPPPGDGAENPDRIGLSHDGQPGTAWPTLQYQGTASFGNLKPGVGVIYDLGSEQAISQVRIATSLPGASVEIRTGTGSTGTLADFPVVAGPVELQSTTEIPIPPDTVTRYVLVWITELVPQQGFFQASLSEVTVLSA